MADPNALQPTNDNNEAIDFGKKKKKKKKDDLLKEAEAETTPTTTATKSSEADKENKPTASGEQAKSSAAAGGEEGGDNEALVDDVELDLTNLKKKGKKSRQTVKFDDDQNEVIEVNIGNLNEIFNLYEPSVCCPVSRSNSRSDQEQRGLEDVV